MAPCPKEGLGARWLPSDIWSMDTTVSAMDAAPDAQDAPPIRLGVLVYAPGRNVDALIVRLAARLKARGLRLAGLLQHDRGECGASDFAMNLEDLATGALLPLALPQPPQPQVCRLDPAGLAAGAAALAAALAEPADLVLVNKFGRQEALGRGLRDELAAAILSGRPVLTSVREDFLPAWIDFAGPDWTRLSPDLATLEAWCATVLALPVAEPAS